MSVLKLSSGFNTLINFGVERGVNCYFFELI